MTGATGFLGVHLAELLIKKGYSIYLLVRPRDNLSPETRVRELFKWLDADLMDQARMHIISGDLNYPDFGLSRDDYHRLASRVDEIIHCASETSFSERKRAQVEKANVENMDHLLDFAVKSSCYFFHLISTAYVAGKGRGQCPESLLEPRTFFNVYEETKYRAEKMAATQCWNEGIRLNIYRPSIVYGHSGTGKTLRFNAIYYPVRTLVFLKNLYQKEMGRQAVEGAGNMGISFDDEGTVLLPIRVEADPDCGINLIPVDFFTAAFSTIMEEAIKGDIFHITNERAKPISEIINYIQNYFNIKGIRTVQGEDFSSGSLNRLEALFNRCIEAYKPYMKDERVFDNRKAAAILDRHGISCPDFDYGIFFTCMGYAEGVNWGNES